MQLLSNDELHIVISAAYADLNQGMEQLRMFDKFMSALEEVAQIEYDESGNIRFHELDALGRVRRDESGHPIPLTFLKNQENPQEIALKGCREWLRARLASAKWPASHSRKVLQILERLEREPAQ